MHEFTSAKKKLIWTVFLLIMCFSIFQSFSRFVNPSIFFHRSNIFFFQKITLKKNGCSNKDVIILCRCCSNHIERFTTILQILLLASLNSFDSNSQHEKTEIPVNSCLLTAPEQKIASVPCESFFFVLSLQPYEANMIESRFPTTILFHHLPLLHLLTRNLPFQGFPSDVWLTIEFWFHHTSIPIDYAAFFSFIISIAPQCYWTTICPTRECKSQFLHPLTDLHFHHLLQKDFSWIPASLFSHPTSRSWVFRCRWKILNF